MRKVVFLQTNPSCTAQYVCGNAIKDQLDIEGVQSKIMYMDSIQDIKDSLVVIFKITLKDSEFDILKRNNNKIVMDVIDEFVRPGTDVLDLYNYSFFDGLIIRVKRIAEEYYFPSHLNVEYIPHHWDVKLREHSVDNTKINYKPVCILNDIRDMPYVQHISTAGLVDFIVKTNSENYTDRIKNFLKYNVHYNLRETNSACYKFKPATKLVTASALGAPLITNYDWALQDMIPGDYPFLIQDTAYRNVLSFIYNIDKIEENQWKYAWDIAKDVRDKTDIANLVYTYINYYKQF